MGTQEWIILVCSNRDCRHDVFHAKQHRQNGQVRIKCRSCGTVLLEAETRQS